MYVLFFSIASLLSLSISASIPPPHNSSFLQSQPQVSESVYEDILPISNFPANWPPAPYTYGNKPIAIRFEEYGRRVTDESLKKAIVRDLHATMEHFITSFEELRDHAPIEYSVGVLTFDVSFTGLDDFAAFEFGHALTLVLELLDVFEWDALEIPRAAIFRAMEPQLLAARFGIRFHETWTKKILSSFTWTWDPFC